MKQTALLSAITLLAIPAVHAQTQPSAWSYSVGGAAMVAPVYQGSGEYKVRPLPAFAITGPVGANGTFQLLGPVAGYQFQVSPELSVGARAEYQFGRDSSDDNTLAGMADIDDSLTFGPEAIYRLSPAWDLNARVMTDVIESDNGTTARIGTTYKTLLSQRTTMSAGAGLTWASEDYMDTHHGVPSFNATAGRPAYNPSAGFQSVDASVGIRHVLTPSWALQTNVGADILLGDAADSPLTDHTISPKATVGLLYRF